MKNERLLKMVTAAHLSEKTARAMEKGYYAFKVTNCATKPEISQAVEHLFNVKVEQVRIVNVKGKFKQFRQKIGRRKSFKKAYVKLQEGYAIDLAGTKA